MLWRTGSVPCHDQLFLQPGHGLWVLCLVLVYLCKATCVVCQVASRGDNHCVWWHLCETRCYPWEGFLLSGFNSAGCWALTSSETEVKRLTIFQDSFLTWIIDLIIIFKLFDLILNDYIRTGSCWLLYNGQAIPCRLKTSWPERRESKCILCKITKMFWESFPPLLCAYLGLPSPDWSFFLTGEQAHSVSLLEVQNIYIWQKGIL